MKFRHVVQSIALPFVASLLSACATQEPAAEPDAAEIATVFFAEHVRQATVTSYWDPSHPERLKEVGCLTSTDARNIGEALVPALRQDLTPAELREAERFLATPAGRAFRDRQLYIGEARPLWQESEEFWAFSKTAAGIKLTSPASLQRYVSVFSPALSKVAPLCGATIEHDPPQKAMPISAYPKFTCVPAAPNYPAHARRMGESGTVMVRMWVNKYGNVYLTLLHRSSGVADLDNEALRAVKTTRCQPYEIDGKPRIVMALQPIRFELH